MESKCLCEWNNGIDYTCGEQTRPCKNSKFCTSSNNSSGPSYWIQKIPTNLSQTQGDSCTNQFSKKKVEKTDSFKEMGSSSVWKYSSGSSCLAPCISSRRLNRTYSEQRMRCLLTTTIAFCLGISVGALLPFVFPPVDILPSNNESVLNARVNFQIVQPQKLLTTPSRNSVSDSNGGESRSAAEEVSFVQRQDINKYVIGGQEEKNTSSTPLHNRVTFVDSSSNSLEKDGGEAGKKSVTNGIFWSDWVERLLPKGFSDEDVAKWRSLAGNSTVASIENGCGRMQNRLITYENGDKACCRYRQNFDQIQGEIFSFYLSQLLGIKNLAPSTLDVINSKSGKWNGVQNEIQVAQWAEDRPVVLTQFVNDLSPAFIPPLLRPSTRRVHPPDIAPLSLSQFEHASSQVNSSDSRIFDDISEMAQWSDLIVFDYLTANLDRMVNNLYNLQWNPTMMEAPAHNLAKDANGLLIFLDNESGLLHGYRLLDKYEHYHRLMLDSLCIFRKSTVEAITRLHSYGSIQPLFKSMLSQFSSSQLLPMIPDKSIKVLNQRIDTVYMQIQKCQSLYTKRTTNLLT